MQSNIPLAGLLLEWYDKNGRDLPWRIKGGAYPDAYAVLVSEFMLQQTTVKTVIPYFQRFMSRFPTVFDLAAASIDEVYRFWQGLGYYSRARSLHSTAQIIVNDFNGVVPLTPADLLKLKGIGPYTAASISALAFNQPAVVIDGNVIRVICRLYHLSDSVDAIMMQIKAKAAALTSSERAADYASAIMDLGALICTPKNPQCLLCPWQRVCLSKNQPDLEQIPHREILTKKEKQAFVYVINNSKGQLFIHQRIKKGLLSGLYEFPWGEADNNSQLNDAAFEKLQTKGILKSAQSLNMSVVHVFTHFKLTLHLQTITVETLPIDGIFVNIANLNNYPMSTLMKKVCQKINKSINQTDV